MPIVKLDVPIPTEVPEKLLEWIKLRFAANEIYQSFHASWLLRIAEQRGYKRVVKDIRTLMDRLGADFVVRREALEAAHAKA